MCVIHQLLAPRFFGLMSDREDEEDRQLSRRDLTNRNVIILVAT